jgi:hypothetical protein
LLPERNNAVLCYGQRNRFRVYLAGSYYGLLRQVRVKRGFVAALQMVPSNALHSADPRSQLGTQQARVGGFMSEAAHGCELLVDGVCSQTA